MHFGYFIHLILFFGFAYGKFTPDWDSLDSRTNPEWYDADKFGIFVHWGVYSVPAFRTEWFWYYWKTSKDAQVIDFMAKNYKNGTSYVEFAPEFTASEFDANRFADVIKSSGARYFVLTSKHHEGYTLWPSATTFGWNAVDVGPHRDLVGELAEAIRARDIHFGLYFSQMAWYHPLYMRDGELKTTEYPEIISLPQMRELVETYKPDVIWSDGDWERTPDYWRSTQFIAWLFNESPIKDTVVVNDRWGHGAEGKHGSFLSNGDRFIPPHILGRKWEACMTMDRTAWGYRRNMKLEDILTSHDVVALLAEVLSKGGNLLLNIGPDHLGNIPLIFETRLREVGAFVGANSEAIFESKPWIHQNDSLDIWYTSRMRSLDFGEFYNPQLEEETIIYAFVLKWDPSNWVTLKSVRPTNRTKVMLLGTGMELQMSKDSPLRVLLPDVQKFPSALGAVLRIEYASNSKHRPKVETPRPRQRGPFPH